MQDKNDKRNISGAQFPQPREEFAVRSATSGMSWNFDGAALPEGMYIDLNDRLAVSFSGVGSNGLLIVNVRILGLDGLIHVISLNSPNSGTRALPLTFFPLMEGILLSVSATVSGGTGVPSAMYASVGLSRAPLNAQSVYVNLCAGYLNSSVPLSWPGAVPIRTVDGPGVYNIITAGGVPAPGAEWIITVPAGMRFRVVSVSAALTTSAVVANRSPNLVIDDGVNILAEIPSTNAQAASTTARYTWMDGGVFAVAPAGLNLAPLPGNCILMAGSRVRSLTTLLDVADQWTNAFQLTGLWLEPL